MDERQFKQQEKDFVATYDAYADAIFRHIYYRFGDRERSRDLMQEAFTKVWDYLCAGKKVKNVRALLYTTATHLVIDELRKKKTTSLDALQEEGFDPASRDHERIQSAVALAQLLSVVDKLDESYRTVVLMRFVDEMTPKEIAAVLDESSNVVSVRIHRGMSQLRKLLEHQGGSH